MRKINRNTHFILLSYHSFENAQKKLVQLQQLVIYCIAAKVKIQLNNYIL